MLIIKLNNAVYGLAPMPQLKTYDDPLPALQAEVEEHSCQLFNLGSII